MLKKIRFHFHSFHSFHSFHINFGTENFNLRTNAVHIQSHVYCTTGKHKLKKLKQLNQTIEYNKMDIVHIIFSISLPTSILLDRHHYRISLKSFKKNSKIIFET